MMVRILIMDDTESIAGYTSVVELLEEKIDLLAKLYDIKLPAQVTLWTWRGSTDNVTTEMKYAYNINNEMCFRLNLEGPDNLSLAEVLLADAELADYVVFCVIMSFKPRTVPTDLITFYTLKYGYKG